MLTCSFHFLHDARPLQEDTSMATMSKRSFLTSLLTILPLLLMGLAIRSLAIQASPGISDSLPPAATLFPEDFQQKTNKATTPVFFDVNISLHKSNPSATEKQQYEEIIKFFTDGVYEESNGVHKIRTVRFFPAKRFAALCDVIWENKGWPCGAVGGTLSAGKRIHMFDIFEKGWNGSDWSWLGTAFDRRNCGYTIDHEWGHYHYGLCDEYQGSDFSNPCVCWPLSGHENQPFAIMCSQFETLYPTNPDYRWLNFSNENYEDNSQPTGKKKYTNDTAHHDSYGAGIWQTLIREPSKDPKDTAKRKALPARPYYPELKGKEPSGKSLPSIELPSNDSSLPSGAARSDLNIIWMNNKVSMDIVIDKSFSMNDGSKFSNAKAAAKVLVDLALNDTSSLGVTAFDDTVDTSVQAITAVTNSNRPTIKTAIDNIAIGNNTAIGDAAKQSRQKLNTFVGTNTDAKVVFLLSDGYSNSGSTQPDDANLLKSFRDDQIPIFAFGYAADETQVDPRLKKMANETRGLYYYSPTTSTQLVLGYVKALDQATTLDTFYNWKIKDYEPKASPSKTKGGRITAPFEINESISDLRVILVGEHANNGEPVVVRPNGERIVFPIGEYLPSEEVLYVFQDERPERGSYGIEYSDTNFGMRAIVTTQPGEDRPILLTAESVEGPDIPYPKPIVLAADLTRDLPIAGAYITVEVIDPSGTKGQFDLLDDGQGVDAMADDGRYSAIYNYKYTGRYSFFITANNQNGTARETYRGLSVERDHEGNVLPQTSDIPITQNFSRSDFLQVRVYDVLRDDHGDTPEEGTEITPDDQGDSGRIEGREDRDWFRVIAPATATTLTFRVYNLSPDMIPLVEVADGDQNRIGGYDPEKQDFPNVTVSAIPGWTYYAQVRHADPNGVGYYDISVGAGTDTYLQEDFEIHAGWNLVGYPGKLTNDRLAALYGRRFSHAVEWFPGAGVNLVEQGVPDTGYFIYIEAGRSFKSRILCEGPEDAAVSLQTRVDGSPSWDWISVPTERLAGSAPAEVQSVFSWTPGVGYNLLQDNVSLLPWRGYIVQLNGLGPYDWIPGTFNSDTMSEKGVLPEPVPPDEFLLGIEVLGVHRFLGVMAQAVDQYGAEDLLAPPLPDLSAPNVSFHEPGGCDPYEPGCVPNDMILDMRPIVGNHVWELRFRNTIAGLVSWGEIPPDWSFRLSGTILTDTITMQPQGAIEVPEASGGFSLYIEASQAEEPSLRPSPLIDLLERLLRGETDFEELIRRSPSWYQNSPR